MSTLNVWRRFWRAETGIFLGLWLGLLLAGRTKLFGDPGTFWHVVVGRQILATGQLPTTDSFTFTYAGQPWIAQQWLGEFFMAWVHDRIGGLDALLLATATLMAGFYTWVVHRLVRAGIHWLLALLVVAFALVASATHIHPRPHLVNIAFLGLTFAWLCDIEAGRIRVWRLLWLVPLYVIWTNIHGGVLGGVGTMALVWFGWTVERVLGFVGLVRSTRTRLSVIQLVVLLILIVACGLTAFVNPYGVTMIRVWLSLMESKILPQLIIEHAPMLHAGRSSVAVLAFAVVYVAALVGTFPMRPRVTWLIPLVWLALTWTRIRHAPLFAVTAAIALGDMYPHIRWVQWLQRRGSTVFPLQPVAQWSWLALVLPAVLFVAAVVFQVRGMRVPVLGSDWVELEPRHWPVELLPELRAYERQHAAGTPIFNDMLFGGFLIYFTPGLRIFIDDRCELYGDQELLAYAHDIDEHPEKVEAWARQYGFDLALTAPDSGFDRYLRCADGWQLVGTTPAANLYRRVGFTSH
jgi:hypothetical protein